MTSTAVTLRAGDIPSVTKDDKEIVSNVLSALIDRVGQDRFDLWIAGRAEFQLAAGTLRILASDHFTLDRLRNKLRGDIVAACEEVLGTTPVLEFHIGELGKNDESPGCTSSADTVAESSMNTGAYRGSLPATEKPNHHASKSAAMKLSPGSAVAAAPASLKLHSASVGPVAASSPADGPRRHYARLETYVVGDGNRVAHTAAASTVNRLGAISPLFFHGPTGCGKTHLLEGILSSTRRSGKAKRTVMLSAEQFTTHFLEALQGSGLPNFRRKHRDVDLLVIDDIQFFAGKKATLVELQHTIDALLRDGRQLVLAADRPPSELSSLGAELVARLSGGLVCGVDAAEPETRTQILRHLVKQLELIVPNDVIEFVGEQLNGDARQLRGALHRLQATSEALNQSITLDFARTALADMLRSSRRAVRLPDIEKAICDVFGLDSKSLQSDRKSRSVSQPRMLAMWLARKHTRAALSEIGHYFGRRSHTTVISAQKKMERLLSKNGTIQIDHATCHIDDALRRVENQLRTG